MLVTCSVDKTVTLWDTQNAINSQPQICGNKDMGVGKLYTVNFYPSSPWLLGCAGGGKEIALWDMTREVAIQKRFGDRVSGGIVYNEKQQDDSTDKQEAFDAMMNNSSKQETSSVPGDSNNGQKKKKTKKLGNNKKKKAHRAGR